MFKDAMTVIVVVAMGISAIFGVAFLGFTIYEFFAPKYRAVDNTVFKQSEQYNDGMIRDLENLQLEYIKADKDQKAALRAITLHRFSVYPEHKMPPNLRNFYNSLKEGN